MLNKKPISLKTSLQSINKRRQKVFQRLDVNGTRCYLSVIPDQPLNAARRSSPTERLEMRRRWNLAGRRDRNSSYERCSFYPGWTSLLKIWETGLDLPPGLFRLWFSAAGTPEQQVSAEDFNLCTPHALYLPQSFKPEMFWSQVCFS